MHFLSDSARQVESNAEYTTALERYRKKSSKIVINRTFRPISSEISELCTSAERELVEMNSI